MLCDATAGALYEDRQGVVVAVLAIREVCDGRARVWRERAIRCCSMMKMWQGGDGGGRRRRLRSLVMPFLPSWSSPVRLVNFLVLARPPPHLGDSDRLWLG